MALIDDPKAWIIHLFEMEEREGRGADCKRYPKGKRPWFAPLEPDERVYGIYKQKYFFTPDALLIKGSGQFKRICWNEIAACTSRHGEGMKSAKLTLTNGCVVNVNIGELAKGHSGRISQLFHQMIEKWGASALCGTQPLSIEAFFDAASDDYCLAPNLDPHPTLDEFKARLLALRDSDGVEDVRLRIVEIDGTAPISDAVIVVSTMPVEGIQTFASHFGADGVIDPPPEVQRTLPTDCREFARMIVWD